MRTGRVGGLILILLVLIGYVTPRRLLSALLAALTIFSFSPASAIPVFDVARVVKEGTGDPVPNVTVDFFFFNSDGDRLPEQGFFSQTTNSNGLFAFFHAPDDVIFYDHKTKMVHGTSATDPKTVTEDTELRPDLVGLLTAAFPVPGLAETALALLSVAAKTDIATIISTEFSKQGNVEVIEVSSSVGSCPIDNPFCGGTQIPEPSALSLFILAGILLLIVKRVSSAEKTAS